MKSMKKTKLAMGAAFAAFASTLAVPSLASAQECIMGEIKWVGFNFTQRGWMQANGALLPISQYTALFSILGTTYGGDGRSTFGLPNYQGRAVVSAGRGPGLTDWRLGQLAGAPDVTLNETNLASHSHGTATTTTIHASSAGGDISSPAGAVLADSGSDRIYQTTASNVNMASDSVSSTTTIQPTGASQLVDITQPSLVLQPLVCAEGVYPSRS